MRQLLYADALETDCRPALQDAFRIMVEEKRQERLLELEERKVKVAEENAKIGRRKLELQAAQSALKLLPRVREALMDGTASAEDRVSRALKCLTEEGGKLMLGNGTDG